MPKKGGTLSVEAREKISAAKRGKKLTDEHCAKVSEAGRGRVLSEETRRKISEARKGKKHSEEAKQKMREARAGREVSVETRAKLSEAAKGRRHTEDTLRKMSEAQRGRTHTEETRAKLRAINTGRTASEETRRKMSETRRGRPGWIPNEEQRRRKSEIAKRRMGWQHSEETKQKIGDALRGRVISAETRQKMSETSKRRCTLAWRAAMSITARAARAEGRVTHLPPVMRGADNPRYGKPLSDAHKQRLREAHLGKPGTPHTDASRTRISEGNVKAIRDRGRTYKHWVTGPDGQQIPCRSDAELTLVQALMKQPGIVAIRGENLLKFVPYEIDGQPRLTVADFEVDRADGVTVVIEGKVKTAFYRKREVFRLIAMWKHCESSEKRFIIAVNGRDVPSVNSGPFVTEEFMRGVENQRIRMLWMEKAMIDVSPGVSVQNSLVSTTSPLD